MLPIRTIGALSLALVSSLLAKEQEFRFEKPEAKTVELMAEFNQWKGQPMTKEANGTWTIKVSIPSGIYGYKFFVDGKDWVFDPKNSSHKTVDGVENSSIEITEDTTKAAPASTPIVAPVPAAKSIGNLSVTPGEVTRFETPLSAKQRAEASKDNARLATAKAAIAVPPAFDPQRSWPILVISNTEAYSNIDSMQQFKQAAVDEGWVIMAADAVEAEKNHEGDCRGPTISAAFDYVMANWPAARDWPVACGGMSGGGKNSAFLAAHLAREHHHIIGMLMMGCNQTWPLSLIANRRHLDFSARPSSSAAENRTPSRLRDNTST